MQKAPRVPQGAVVQRLASTRSVRFAFAQDRATRAPRGQLRGEAADAPGPVEFASLGAAGDFSSGAARSIRVVGGCLFDAGFSDVGLSLGVALSIADVGGCLRGLAWLGFASACPARAAVSAGCWTG